MRSLSVLASLLGVAGGWILLRSLGFFTNTPTGELAGTLLASREQIVRPSPPEVRGGWDALVVDPPVVYQNLVLFPLRAISRDARMVGSLSDRYLTLDEGLKSGEVVITERSGVNELTVINKSSRLLLLLAGEVVVGGKQDRIIGQDVLIPPGGPYPLGVYCVEQGRWRLGEKGEAFGSAGVMVHPEARLSAQGGAGQGKVWEEVGSKQRDLGVSSPTGRFQDIFSGAVSQEIQEAVREVEARFPRGGVVGVIVGMQGRLVWLDLFADAGLFERYRAKLLTSYVLGAKGKSPKEPQKPITIAEAIAFLRNREGATQVTYDERGVFCLTRTQGDSFVFFELGDTTMWPPLTVHAVKMPWSEVKPLRPRLQDRESP